MTSVVGAATGETFPLDPSAELGRGAEGVVYRVRGGRAVKVFKAPLTGEEADKVVAVAAFAKAVPGFAWPIESVKDGGGETVGVALPFVPGRTLEALLDDRATAAIPTQDKVALALAVSRAVAAVHARSGPRVVLGDLLKAANVVVDGTAATFVDTLAVTLYGFRRLNGSTADSVNWLSTPGYVPAEVLDHPHAKPTHAADLFALAVLLHELLFGRSPTEPRPCPAAVGLDPDQAVRDGLFIRYVAHPELDPPTYDPVDPPSEVEGLFRAAFLSVASRPSARRWVKCLKRWHRDITPPSAPVTGPAQGPPARRFVDWLAVAAVVVLGVSGLRWAVDRGPIVTPPTHNLDAHPPLPTVPAGPPQFRETFK